ncbi:hypothetical protein BN59_03060 [Legionella massiliensis]|uniref:Uncharacterized protein n=2 Tax=Legionella massiliensis TaxID=1034943 RepID=A0A078L0G2_9GAMM|nr:hypothetical protein BN59_03060 [Legionella massiliensis]CEE14485.1 hypothetical protein BN1094_03060 [Legionella massiliensis]
MEKPKPSQHPLNEEEKKLITERIVLESPTAKLNFRTKLTHSLFKNPKTGQLFNTETKYKFPSLLDLTVHKIREMKKEGQINDESVNIFPEELIEKVNNLAM